MDAIAVTDFANDFRYRAVGGRQLLELKQEIPWRPTDTIATDFSVRGVPEPQHALWTRNRLYQVYRKEFFTEIVVGTEINPSSELSEDESLGIFDQVVDRFFESYAHASHDHTVHRPKAIGRNHPVVRGATVKYPSTTSLSNFGERLVANLPTNFPIRKRFNIQEFANNAIRANVDPLNVAQRVAVGMESGTVSDAQRALVDSYMHTRRYGNTRFGLIDAFSIIEVEAFAILDEARTNCSWVKAKYEKAISRNKQITVKNVISSYLPIILKRELLSRSTLIGDLNRVRRKRNDAAHKRLEVSTSDVNLALNSAEQLLGAGAEWRRTIT